jgi:hypothetical protein
MCTGHLERKRDDGESRLCSVPGIGLLWTGEGGKASAYPSLCESLPGLHRGGVGGSSWQGISVHPPLLEPPSVITKGRSVRAEMRSASPWPRASNRPKSLWPLTVTLSWPTVTPMPLYDIRKVSIKSVEGGKLVIRRATSSGPVRISSVRPSHLISQLPRSPVHTFSSISNSGLPCSSRKEPDSRYGPPSSSGAEIASKGRSSILTRVLIPTHFRLPSQMTG